MKFNICIDIDGTITEPYYWLELANKYFGKNIKPSDVTKYEIHEVLNIPREDYLKFYELYREHMHIESDLREDAKQILSILKQLHNISYVTARDVALREITVEWFTKHGLPQAELYLLGTHYKVDQAKELKCHIFIEDRYENAIQLALAGFKVLLIDCTYNQRILIPGITRVFSWKDIYEVIEKFKVKPNEGATEIA